MSRIIEIDFIRGIAVILMIVSHFGFFSIITMKNLNYKYNQFPKLGLSFDLLGTISHSLFIILVGVNMVTSYNNTVKKIEKSQANSNINYRISKKGENKNEINKQFTIKTIKRAFLILIFGITMSLLVRWVFKDWLILFGIFQFIALSIIIAIPFQLFYNPIVLTITFIISILIPNFFKKNNINLGTYFNIILGNFTKNQVNYLDYFPIFPYFALILVGIFIGNLSNLPKFTNNLKKNKLINQISHKGQYSIQLYFMHILLIFTVMKLLITKKIKL